MPVNGPAIASIGVGALFVYGGIKGYSILKATQNVVQGASPNAGQTTTLISSPNNTTTNASIIQNATGNGNGEELGASANQALAQPLAAAYGWGSGDEWSALLQLWNDESGWRNTAENASGAYGIAQALPNTKYPIAGQPPSEGGEADSTTQIEWGLAYIKSRYGDPIAALAHENSYHWY